MDAIYSSEVRRMVSIQHYPRSWGSHAIWNVKRLKLGWAEPSKKDNEPLSLAFGSFPRKTQSSIDSQIRNGELSLWTFLKAAQGSEWFLSLDVNLTEKRPTASFEVRTIHLGLGKLRLEQSDPFIVGEYVTRHGPRAEKGAESKFSLRERGIERPIFKAASFNLWSIQDETFRGVDRRYWWARRSFWKEWSIRHSTRGDLA